MLKTIIQTTTIALICLATISCEKEVPIKGDSISEPTAETESSSLDDFTVILSKAVANDKDLRDFIDDTESATLSYTTTLDSEDLGMEPFEYTSNILSKPITENVNGTNMPGYIVSSTSVGAVTITFLPTDIR